MFSCSLQSNEVHLTEGQEAPNFTLKDQEGNEHTLSSYRGKKVVIYYLVPITKIARDLYGIRPG